MNIQGCIPRFIKGHGSLILTILSGIGLIATVAVTAKQAPKAENAMKDARCDKIDEICDRLIDSKELPEGVEDDNYSILNYAREHSDLTFTEKVKAAGPYYLPVILLGLGTLGCMAGAQILNTRKQAAMTLAYAMLSQDFGAYRKEIRDEYGAEADQKAYIASQKKIENLEAEIRRLEDIKGVYTFGISTLPGVIFRSDMGNIERAFLHFNRNLILRGWNDLEELYSFIGLPEETWKFIEKVPDEDYGWNSYLNEVQFGCSFLDYRLETVTDKDGKEAYLITFDIPPYRIDGPEYDENEPGEFYGGYDPAKAKRMLQRGINDIPVLIDYVSNNVSAPAYG